MYTQSRELPKVPYGKWSGGEYVLNLVSITALFDLQQGVRGLCENKSHRLKLSSLLNT